MIKQQSESKLINGVAGKTTGHVILLTSCFGLITDSAVVDSALVGAALRKSGLISN